MAIDVTVKIGGEAGQGIQTVGDLLSFVCQKAGLYIMAINDFESRIRGGHSFLQIRISDRPVAAPHREVHLLVALDERSYELHQHELAPGGLTLLNSENGFQKEGLIGVPIDALAKKAGGVITANTVAAGACLGLLGAPPELLHEILMDRFREKGETIVKNNLTAAGLGEEAIRNTPFQWSFAWRRETPKGTLMNGSKAIALGALAADCRFASFYPMSPATSILSYLSDFSESFPIIVEQAEDEISAVNMVIGASFAGVRAMTATSGGGFCLMTEGLGLSGITETPLVIVNAQRPGPATGLATRTAQGDLLFVIRASQDEFHRFVFAPGTPEEAFDATIRAFHLSQKYQVPAIVLTDQFLNDSLYISEKPFRVPGQIDSFVVTDKELSDPKAYKRYAITPTGVSPRVLPCQGKALVVVSGNEHSEDGHSSEDILTRVNMVKKRNSKISHMTEEMKPPEASYEESEVLLIGWGSTKGAIRESVYRLRESGVDAGCLHFRDIWPFPSELALPLFKKAKKLIVVEQNSASQFGALIREETGVTCHGSVLKYDGRPFYPDEIVNEVKRMVG